MRTSSRHSTTAGPVCCRSSTTSFLLLHCSTSNLRRTRGLITSVCVWLCYDDRVVWFINSCALLLLLLPFLLPLQQPLQQRARRGIVRHIYGERRFSASPWLQRSIHPESLRRSSSNPKSQPIPSSDQHRVPDHKTSLTGQSVVSFSSSSRFLLHKSASCNTVANTLQTPFNDGSSSRKKKSFSIRDLSRGHHYHRFHPNPSPDGGTHEPTLLSLTNTPSRRCCFCTSVVGTQSRTGIGVATTTTPLPSSADWPPSRCSSGKKKNEE